MKKRYIILVVLLAVVITGGLLRTPDTDAVAMIAKYTNEQSRFVENEAGLRVHYRDEGNPNGTPIVLLHGNSASLHTWAPMLERLGDDYRIITYSQPGHGLTGAHPRDDYSFAGMAEALELVVDELDLERFVLGGNSMGGWMSWRYALAHPHQIEALILIDASGMPLREGEVAPPLNLGFRLLQNPIGRLLLEHYTPRSIVKQSILDTVSVKSIVTENMVDQYWELLRFPKNRRAAAHRALADRELAMADRVGEITVPTLIIWGDEDQLIYVSAAQTFDERMPNAEIEIFEGVGHLPMEEAPDKTAASIHSFLEGLIQQAE